MRWVLRGYVIVMLAYTGWRTYDFMIQQLPVGVLSTWLAIMFLFSTEIGLLIWHEVSLSHTTTYAQHYTATALTWINFVGSTAAGVADMILRQTFYEYTIPPTLATGLIYGMPLIVAINVAGALYFLSNDADTQRAQQQRFLGFEAHKQAYDELKTQRRRIVQSAKKKLIQDITGTYAWELPLNPEPDAINGKDTAIKPGKNAIKTEPNAIVAGKSTQLTPPELPLIEAGSDNGSNPTRRRSSKKS